jgi:hypothetical protein
MELDRLASAADLDNKAMQSAAKVVFATHGVLVLTVASPSTRGAVAISVRICF